MPGPLEKLLNDILRKDRKRPDPEQTKTEDDIRDASAERTVFSEDETVCGGVNPTACETEAESLLKPSDTEGVVLSSDRPFEKGGVLLGTYRVESDPIHGGMGSVWRVRHLGWDTDLAMKRPKAEMFRTDRQKETFVRECECWMTLGLHPNVVSCYYVREIEGVPTIFSEWMDGGSLESRIRDGSLYAGEPAECEKRLLDLAIQFARGLKYAHEQKIIHQDVKPDNVLLSADGEAKVADFGIARAKAALTVSENGETDSGAGSTVIVQSGGYTPAYCSMEQMNGEPLTRRTDIYSWAVSVMEAYLGERPWDNGVVAGLACDGYLSGTRVPMPEKLRALLTGCLSANPDERPHDFAAVEQELLDVWRAAYGCEYPRKSVSSLKDTAEGLNNRALGFWDIGRREEALQIWKQALDSNAVSADANFNYALALWRSGNAQPQQAKDQLRGIPDSALRKKLLAELSMEISAIELDTPCYEERFRMNAYSFTVDGRLMNGVTCAPDGQRTSGPEAYRVVETRTGRVLIEKEAKEGEERYSVSREGRWAWAYQREPQGISIREISTGREIWRLQCRSQIHPPILVSDGGWLLANGRDCVQAVNIVTGQRAPDIPGVEIETVTRTENEFLPGEWALLKMRAPEHRFALVQPPMRTGGEARIVKLPESEPDDGAVKAIAYSREGTLFAGVNRLWLLRTDDGSAELLHVYRRSGLQRFDVYNDGYRNAAFLNDGRIVMAMDYHNIYLWDTESERELDTVSRWRVPLLSQWLSDDYKYHVRDEFRLWRMTGAGCYCPDRKAEFRLSRAESAGERETAESRYRGLLQSAEEAYRANDRKKAIEALDAAMAVPGFDADAELLKKRCEYAEGLEKRGIRRVVPTEKTVTPEEAAACMPKKTGEAFDAAAAPELEELRLRMKERIEEGERPRGNSWRKRAEEDPVSSYECTAEAERSGWLSANGCAAVYRLTADEYYDDGRNDGTDIRHNRQHALAVIDGEGRELYSNMNIDRGIEDRYIHTSLSPDGRFLIYTASLGARLVDLEGTQWPENVFGGKCAAASFTPDGAFILLLTEAAEIHIIRTDSKEQWFEFGLPRSETRADRGLFSQEYDSVYPLDGNSFAVRQNGEYRLYMIDWAYDFGES